MIGKLIERPIAVTMAIVALVVLGVVSIGLLPISLMPNVDIPQITIQFSYKGASAREVNDVVIKQMRQQLIQLSDLEELTCTANNGGGIIFMQFDYGSDTDLNFIEVNEKIDRLLPSLPKDMERPRIIKASATDIPVFFIDLTIDEQSDEAFIELSKFAREVIVKRIEQIPQVAMVDVSGILGSQFVIEPDMGKLLSLGLKVEDLERAITDNNVSLGNLSIKDGYYQWNIRFDSQIDEVSDIENINLKINGRIYLFKDLADVKEEPADVSGMVRSAGKRAVTFAVLKQSDARMADLQVEIDRLMESFHTDYPDIDFTITRNQTELLDYSIDNLKSNIIVGAILAIIIIFLFMRDLRSPVLICITIPLSLIVSLLMLYVLGISINIISLSGLILGMGMMVDNSIIVIDNITQRRERGDSFKYAIAKGTSEVFAPMLSSVLTTCAVFVPLIFLSGIAGALFYDQAMAVTTALFSSLFVAVLVIPVYYRLLYRKEENLSGAALVKSHKERAYHRIYEKSVFWIFRHPKTSWAIFLSFIPLTFIFYGILDKSKLPPLTHTESVLSIEWNEPTNVVASDARIMDLLNRFDSEILEYSVLVGTQDFMLSHTPNQEISQVSVYMKAESMEKLTELEGKIAEYLDKKYAGVSYDFKQAANIFNLIFSDNEPTLVAMIRGREGNVPQPDELNAFLEKIGKRLPEIYLEPVLWQEEILYVVDKEKMALYGVDYNAVNSVLSRATKENTLLSVNSGTFSIPIVLSDVTARENSLLALKVRTEKNTGTEVIHVDVPVGELVTEKRIRDLKNITSGKDGDYYPLNIMADDDDVRHIMAVIDECAKEADYNIAYSGAYFSNREMIKELAAVLVISVLLLFFILAAQFESLMQPVVIMSEIVVDLFGALFFLWIFGSGINIMSLIGIVVMCGIIINDSILKVDTINKLRAEGYGLLRAVIVAGARRLKPILMTSLTTILAIAPFLVRGDMGSDLQYPLSVALIGGMILGTFVSILFIPIFYYELYRKRQ